MKHDPIDLYGGKVRGNPIGSFIKNGINFDIIRPGYDAQGRRRLAWTQFIYKGVPVFEVKINTDLPVALNKFDEMWAQFIGDDTALAVKALERCKTVRTSKFQDGSTGETPAPSVVPDGRPDGKIYPA